jgi:hypothetical protein
MNGKEGSKLSLSQSHDYHHLDSLQLMDRKEGSKQHFLESTEEAYYLVVVMPSVSFFLCRFGAKGISIWGLCKCFKIIISKRLKKS